MEESEVVDQSVETGDTSVTEESAPQAESSEAESQASAPEAKQEEKLSPFHEHPRFKEVIEQNRGYKTQLEEYQGALRSLQQQMETLRQQAAPKAEPTKDPFLADLEKVNPAYAKSFQSVMERAAKADDIEKRLQAYEQQQFAEKAYGHFDNLLRSNKVSDTFDQEVYKAAVEAEVFRRESQGKRLGIKDLDGIFNDFHSKYSKAMEERNRKLTASYVKEKSKDTTPKGATGGVASTPGAKKLAAGDFGGQAKWLADQIRGLKKTI